MIQDKRKKESIKLFLKLDNQLLKFNTESMAVSENLPDRTTLYPLIYKSYTPLDISLKALPVVLPDPEEDPIDREEWVRRLYEPTTESFLYKKIGVLANLLAMINRDRLPVANLFERIDKGTRSKSFYRRTTPLTIEEIKAVQREEPRSPIHVNELEGEVFKPLDSFTSKQGPEIPDETFVISFPLVSHINVGDRFRGLLPKE